MWILIHLSLITYGSQALALLPRLSGPGPLILIHLSHITYGSGASALLPRLTGPGILKHLSHMAYGSQPGFSVMNTIN